MPVDGPKLAGEWQTGLGMPHPQAFRKASQPLPLEEAVLWLRPRLAEDGYIIGDKLGEGYFGAAYALLTPDGSPTGLVLKITTDLNEIATTHRILSKNIESPILPRLVGAWWGLPNGMGAIVREDVEDTCKGMSPKLCATMEAYKKLPRGMTTYQDLLASLSPAENAVFDTYLSELGRLSEKYGLRFFDLHTKNVRLRKMPTPSLVITDFGLSTGPETEVPVAENPGRFRRARRKESKLRQNAGQDTRYTLPTRGEYGLRAAKTRNDLEPRGVDDVGEVYLSTHRATTFFLQDLAWLRPRLATLDLRVGGKLGSGALGVVYSLLRVDGTPTNLVIKLTRDVHEVGLAQRILQSNIRSPVLPELRGAWWGLPSDSGFIIREDIPTPLSESHPNIGTLLYLSTSWVAGERRPFGSSTFTGRPSVVEAPEVELSPEEDRLFGEFREELVHLRETYGLQFFDLHGDNVRYRPYAPKSLVVTDFGFASRPEVVIPIAENPRRSRKNGSRIGRRSMGYWMQVGDVMRRHGGSYGQPNPPLKEFRAAPRNYVVCLMVDDKVGAIFGDYETAHDAAYAWGLLEADYQEQNTPLQRMVDTHRLAVVDRRTKQEVPREKLLDSVKKTGKARFLALDNPPSLEELEPADPYDAASVTRLRRNLVFHVHPDRLRALLGREPTAAERSEASRRAQGILSAEPHELNRLLHALQGRSGSTEPEPRQRGYASRAVQAEMRRREQERESWLSPESRRAADLSFSDHWGEGTLRHADYLGLFQHSLHPERFAHVYQSHHQPEVRWYVYPATGRAPGGQTWGRAMKSERLKSNHEKWKKYKGAE
jgi:hypothetical protein